MANQPIYAIDHGRFLYVLRRNKRDYLYMMQEISKSAGNSKTGCVMKKCIVYVAFISLFHAAIAQNEIKIYPSSWWVGMKNPHLQLMLRGKNIGK